MVELPSVLSFLNMALSSEDSIGGAVDALNRPFMGEEEEEE